MRMPGRNSRSPMRSFRKLVLRATDAPLIADARCPTSDPAMRGSNTIGTRRVSTLRGLSRFIARSPALRPIFSGGFQVGGMQRRGEVVVALHPGAFAGDRHRGDRVARAHIGAAKTMARRQHDAADTGRRARPARFGHAFHAERRLLGGARGPLERRDVRDARVDQVELGKIARQRARVGKARIGVLGRDPRHRDRALGERVRAIAFQVIGGDHRLALADQHAQAHVVAFGALALLDLAVAQLDRCETERTATASAASAPAGVPPRPGVRQGR